MIRIVIADDHAIVREGLKRIVASADDMEVLAEAANGFITGQVVYVCGGTSIGSLVL